MLTFRFIYQTQVSQIKNGNISHEFINLLNLSYKFRHLRKTILYIFRTCNFLMDHFSWPRNLILFYITSEKHFGVWFRPSVKISNISANNWGRRAMSDFRCQKSGDANARHSHVTRKFTFRQSGRTAAVHQMSHLVRKIRIKSYPYFT